MSGWQPDPILWAEVVLATVVYGRWAARARRWPARRTAAWLAGLATVVGALLSPLDAAADRSMSAHMVSHLLLMMVAAPLLLAGAPLALALRASPPLRGPLRQLLHSRLAAVLTHPATGLVLLTAVTVGTHIPAFYDAALEHDQLHALEHVLYLVCALIFWAPVLAIRPLPRRRSPLVRVLVLVGAMVPMVFTGLAIQLPMRPSYSFYVRAERSPGAALADQEDAGNIMWWGSTVPMGVLVLAIGIAGLQAEERRQERRETALVRAPGGGAP